MINVKSVKVGMLVMAVFAITAPSGECTTKRKDIMKIIGEMREREKKEKSGPTLSGLYQCSRCVKFAPVYKLYRDGTYSYGASSKTDKTGVYQIVDYMLNPEGSLMQGTIKFRQNSDGRETTATYGGDGFNITVINNNIPGVLTYNRKEGTSVETAAYRKSSLK